MTTADVDIAGAIDHAADRIADKVVAWRHDIHRHPELSNREERTAALVADHLRSVGLDEVRTGVAGHGVVGVLRGGRPGGRAAGLRADIDALPVKEASGVDFASTVVDADYPGGPFPVAHACGHDCHTAMLMGAAEVLSGLREHLPGAVVFIFQPAEEGPPVDESGGARAMAGDPALADPVPTMAFGMHVAPLPANTVGYRSGNTYAASCVIKIRIDGKQVHGSTPWEGTDPMPAAADTISGLGQVYRQVPATSPVTVSIGHVEDVGRFNIIGGRVTLWGTIRCLVQSDMDTVQDHVRRTADHMARAYGCTATTEFLQRVPPVYNAPEWVDAALPTLRRVMGEDGVHETPPGLPYDDVSEFIDRYGGLYVNLGCQDLRYREDGTMEAVPGGRGMVFNHHPGFYADDSVLKTGVRLHANAAVDHLEGRLTA
ncbi:amidohydrolase [Nocardiopsis sp. RSe5-2]|uniref:Amidohydrolase n=1 Tax=Nocardiopsis endophytica TaxID=3018445 RepID=A0ABT4U5K9_9ACTN|nr:amidohydrolase [Nocardiopsis endophytica]MDA2812234.1 amidohydrolase [Nocardiopsis endophytica]